MLTHSQEDTHTLKQKSKTTRPPLHIAPLHYAIMINSLSYKFSINVFKSGTENLRNYNVIVHCSICNHP